MDTKTAQAIHQQLESILFSDSRNSFKLQIMSDQGTTIGRSIELAREDLLFLDRIFNKWALYQDIQNDDKEMTTQEASQLLGVSRPFLIKLLEKGEIPYRKVGSHRRIHKSDILQYRYENQVKREKILDSIHILSEEISLKY